MILATTTFEDRCETAECRSCQATGLRPVVDLGRMPLSDGFLPDVASTRTEPRYPLEVAFCPECSLVQILETVDPGELFQKDYPYYSSVIDTLMKHSRENALRLIEDRDLGPESLVVELASNDGYLLRNFVESGVPVLGIDPAAGPAAKAEEAGVPTIVDFFGRDLAWKLVAEGKRADVILANNVLAHVADLNGFVAGIGVLLKDDGIASIEVPYVRDLVDHGEFDTIYHEHLCYFSVIALDKLFRRHGLFLNDLTPLDIHGGSLRLTVGRRDRRTKIVVDHLGGEHDLGLDRHGYYESFGRKVQAIREGLLQLLLGLKAKGARIAAYGAAAKGTILLNAAGIGPEILDFVADRNPVKQGKLVPGVHIPVRSPRTLIERQPDYCLLLAWNFRDEILAQQEEYRRRGGRFVVPIPRPEVIG